MKKNLSLLTVVLLVAMVLASCSPMDIVRREITVVETENFRVNNAMMTYFFWMQLDSYYEYYYRMLAEYYGDEYACENAYTFLGIQDSEKSLKEQKMSTASEAESESVFDYYMSITEDYVTRMLTYCELALKSGMELTQEDMQEIDREYEIFRESYPSKKLGDMFSESSDSGMFAKGLADLREKDVRNCLELIQLAAKFENSLIEELTLPGENYPSQEVMEEWYENNLLVLEYNREAYKYIDA